KNAHESEVPGERPLAMAGIPGLPSPIHSPSRSRRIHGSYPPFDPRVRGVTLTPRPVRTPGRARGARAGPPFQPPQRYAKMTVELLRSGLLNSLYSLFGRNRENGGTMALSSPVLVLPACR